MGILYKWSDTPAFTEHNVFEAYPGCGCMCFSFLSLSSILTHFVLEKKPPTITWKPNFVVVLQLFSIWNESIFVPGKWGVLISFPLLFECLLKRKRLIK